MALMANFRMGQMQVLWLSMFYWHSDSNNIVSTGAKLLIKADFPLLQILDLCNYLINLAECKIGNEGAKHLAKGQWPKVSCLRIRDSIFIQAKIR